MAIKAVIFDMDGTLVDSESVSAAAWHRTAQTKDIEIPDSFIRSLIGRNYQSCRLRLIEHVGGDEEFADEVLEQYVEDFLEMAETDLELMEGAREALAQLHEMGLPLALATSTSHALAIPRLERFGMQDEFVVVVCGDEIENGKPAPDIFLAAAKQLEVAPADCAVVEDSFNGVRSGHAAGTRVFMVPDLVEPTDEIRSMCAAVLPSLLELPKAIARA